MACTFCGGDDAWVHEIDEARAHFRMYGKGAALARNLALCERCEQLYRAGDDDALVALQSEGMPADEVDEEVRKPMTGEMFHLSAVENRASIDDHGLDWRRMGAARGLAGAREPELEGIFLCEDQGDVSWFVRLNNTGGAIDVWAVDGISAGDLHESPEGYRYLPRPIPRAQLRLVARDIAPIPRSAPGESSGSSAYRSTLTITWDED